MQPSNIPRLTSGLNKIMDSITSKAVIKKIIDELPSSQTEVLTHYIHQSLLTKKVKFPLLEYASVELFQKIPSSQQIKLLDALIQLHTIGGNTIAGKLLQLRLTENYIQSLKKAESYIITGDQWYVCDIIGERVFGYALLIQPANTIPELFQLKDHQNKWMVRAIGVATHYAVKKGLKKVHTKQMFELLLSLSNTTDFHTKKGIGWAAKTIAKFHPEIIQHYKSRLETDTEIKQWFKTKIKIGLGRTSKYASKYSD